MRGAASITWGEPHRSAALGDPAATVAEGAELPAAAAQVARALSSLLKDEERPANSRCSIQIPPRERCKRPQYGSRTSRTLPAHTR